jgi:hypothetical protein
MSRSVRFFPVFCFYVFLLGAALVPGFAHAQGSGSQERTAAVENQLNMAQGLRSSGQYQAAAALLDSLAGVIEQDPDVPGWLVRAVNSKRQAAEDLLGFPPRSRPRSRWRTV